MPRHREYPARLLLPNGRKRNHGCRLNIQGILLSQKSNPATIRYLSANLRAAAASKTAFSPHLKGMYELREIVF